MKTTTEKLSIKLRAMPADELREFAANVVRILYLVHDEENDPPCLDSAKEWTQDEIERIAEEVEAAGLHPEKVAGFQPAPVGNSHVHPTIAAALPQLAPASAFHAFHWPDHVIGKRESRRIRDAHNALYNSHAELLAAAKMAQFCLDPKNDERVSLEDLKRTHAAIDGSIAIAEGRQP